MVLICGGVLVVTLIVLCLAIIILILHLSVTSVM